MIAKQHDAKPPSEISHAKKALQKIFRSAHCVFKFETDHACRYWRSAAAQAELRRCLRRPSSSITAAARRVGGGVELCRRLARQAQQLRRRLQPNRPARLSEASVIDHAPGPSDSAAPLSCCQSWLACLPSRPSQLSRFITSMKSELVAFMPVVMYLVTSPKLKAGRAPKYPPACRLQRRFPWIDTPRLIGIDTAVAPQASTRRPVFLDGTRIFSPSKIGKAVRSGFSCHQQHGIARRPEPQKVRSAEFFTQQINIGSRSPLSCWCRG